MADRIRVGNNAGIISTGADAHNVVNHVGRAGDDVDERLDRLTELVEAHAGAIEGHRHALADIDEIRRLRRETDVDKPRLRDACRRLLERAAAVGAVVSAVTDIMGVLGVRPM